MVNDLRTKPDADEHVVLVAFTVSADTPVNAQEVLLDILPDAGTESTYGVLDSWWIAEDERIDRSDNDSAVFVPMGKQNHTLELFAMLGRLQDRLQELVEIIPDRNPQ